MKSWKMVYIFSKRQEKISNIEDRSRSLGCVPAFAMMKGDHSKEVSPCTYRQPSSSSLARAFNSVLAPFFVYHLRISFFYAIYTHPHAFARVSNDREFFACSCRLKRVRHINCTCYNAWRASIAILSMNIAGCRVIIIFQ